MKMVNMRDYSVIIAARTGSKRLPGKALLPLKGLPMISFLIRRLKTSKLTKQIILATTVLPEDDLLVWTAKQQGIGVFRGATEDVVERFVEAARAYNIAYVVRVTGDCPFVDGPSLDYCLAKCDLEKDFDLATTKGSFPVGIDYEIYNAETMSRLHEKTLTLDEREHLTLAIYKRSNSHKIVRVRPPDKWPKSLVNFTVDTEQDYELAKTICESQKGINFKIPDLLRQV